MAHRRSRHPRPDGFTLLEVLIALSIFSFAVIAHLSLQTENVTTVSALQEKALARMVAENTLAEALGAAEPLVPGRLKGETAMGDRRWVWTRTIVPTNNPDILRITVSVRGEDQRETREIASAMGFRSAT